MRTLLVVVTLAVLTGCGSGSAGSPGWATPTSPTTLTPIRIVRTGGLAGVEQKIVVDIDGSWIYTDKRVKLPQVGQLSDDVLARLIQQVSEPAFAEQGLRDPVVTSCPADTFHYLIAFSWLELNFDECDRDNRPALMAVIATVADATPL